MRLSTVMILCICLWSWVSTASAEGVWREQPANKAPRQLGYEHLALDQYNAEWVQEQYRKNYAEQGQARVVRMFEQRTLASFTAGERAFEWATRQRANPEAIVIEKGCLTLEQVFKQINNNRYLSKSEESIYLLKVPLAVESDACLLVDDSVAELRLSLEGGVFISTSGRLFVLNSTVVGWSENLNAPTEFRKEKEFRPFLVSWDGSEIYFYRSLFQSLGYSNSKSYGVSLSKYTEAAIKYMPDDLAAPTGWILESIFDDLYFGFYCYESEGVIIHKNVYKNNIVYGIDPHDRSRKLVISQNEVYGTKKKHGIIMSREVNDSWIIGNKSYNNHLSGIVLDRACEDNLIADNFSYNNGADGVTFYESGHNVLYKNKAFANNHHGMRLRNSDSLTLVENEIIANGRLGLFLLAQDLSDTDRNFKQDPYSTRIGIDLEGGVFAANTSGPMKLDEPETFRLHNVHFRFSAKAGNMILPGFLKEKTLDIFRVATNDKKELLYVKEPLGGTGH